MINSLQIKNFKSIKNLNIRLKNFNILSGENASGKTSIIHSILLLTQKTKSDITLDGNIIKIGSLSELKNYNNGESIEIQIDCNNYKKKLKLNKNKDVSSIFTETLIVEPEEDVVCFEKNLFYLSSNRIGVMDTYTKGNFLFGSNGEAVIDFLYKNSESPIKPEYLTLFKQKINNEAVNENPKFSEHVRFWMEFITGETFSLSSIVNTNQYIISYGKNIRPINTGSGLSFLLPIIVVCLGAILIGENNPTVILENPEIYLHPAAQDKLMKFLEFCSNFIQLIIETHSEHILKRAVELKNNQSTIFITKLINDETKITSFTKSNFKTSPISYSEVIYKAFGILTPELHILLYGQLHGKYNLDNGIAYSGLAAFDNYLQHLPNVPMKQWININNGVTYYTLPTYIRNKIDHPEARKPNSNRKYSFTEKELKSSIDFLLNNL